MKITKYCIFVNGENDKKEIAEMIHLLTKNKIQRNQIRIYDVSGEKQINLYFKQNNYSYPVLFLWGNLYGSLEYVKEQSNQGLLRLALLNNPNKGKKGNSNFEFNPEVREEIEEEKVQNKIVVPKHKPKKVMKKKNKKQKKQVQNEVKEETVEVELKEEKEEINETNENEIKQVEIIEEIIEEQKQEEVIIEIKEEKKEIIEETKEEIQQFKIEIIQEEQQQEEKEDDSFEENLIHITEKFDENEIQKEKEEINQINQILQQEIEMKDIQQEIIPILDIEINEDYEKPNENSKEMIIIEDYDCGNQIENDQYFELNVPQLNTLNLNDKWLNACEWVLRTLNPIKPTPIKEDPTYLEKKETDIDYYVTRTNWYWRHQIRIIRFTNECFYRLDEEYRIREKFDYESVSEIIQTDYEHVIIKFSSNSQDQYLQSKLCSQLIKTLIYHINIDKCKLKLIN